MQDFENCRLEATAFQCGRSSSLSTSRSTLLFCLFLSSSCVPVVCCRPMITFLVVIRNETSPPMFLCERVVLSLWRRRPLLFALIAISTFILLAFQYHSVSSTKPSVSEQRSAGHAGLRQFLSLSVIRDDSLPLQKDSIVQTSDQNDSPFQDRKPGNRPNASRESNPESNEDSDTLSEKKMVQKYDNILRCSCALQVPRILLITYFRSGSSFLGDLLQQSCRTFYSFEPLHYMTEGVRIPDSRAEEAFFLLGRMMECSFPEISYYVKWALRPENRFLFKWNRLLWSRCRIRPVSCFNAAFIKDVCSKAHVQVIKTTRMHMRQVRSFLQTLDRSMRDALKIVYLVRDPRGIFNSRKNLVWCANNTCADPRVICTEMAEDLSEFHKLKSEMPDHFFLLRYEDLSLSPEKTATTLFQQLQLPFSKQVSRFLRSHTTVDPQSLGSEIENPYSTRRNSVATAMDWVNKLTAREIESTQSACHHVISELQYLHINRHDVTAEADSSPDPLLFVNEIAKNSGFFSGATTRTVTSHNTSH